MTSCPLSKMPLKTPLTPAEDPPLDMSTIENGERNGSMQGPSDPPLDMSTIENGERNGRMQGPSALKFQTGMNLIKVEISKFFGLDNVVIEMSQNSQLRPTLLVGANGSGKTSIFRSIQFFVENFPYVHQREGEAGKVDGDWQLSWSKYRCWIPDKSAHIQLTFRVTIDLQEKLLRWRRLGLLEHVRKVLKLPHIRRRLLTDIVGMNRQDDDDACEFWQTLAQKLRSVHEASLQSGSSYFSYLTYSLKPTKNNHRVVQYNKPSFSFENPAEKKRGLSADTFHEDEENVIVEVLINEGIVPPIEEEGGLLQASVREFLQEMNAPTWELQDHFRKKWHPFAIGSRGEMRTGEMGGTTDITRNNIADYYDTNRKEGVLKVTPMKDELVLQDDFVFMDRIAASWCREKGYEDLVHDPKYATNMTQERNKSRYDDKKFHEQKKKVLRKYYNKNTASTDQRSACTDQLCEFFDPRQRCIHYKTRKLSDPLLIPLRSQTPHVFLKSEVEFFISGISRAAFPRAPPHGFVDPALRFKEKDFICAALLRTSMGWVQQYRQCDPATSTYWKGGAHAESELFRLPTLYDFDQALALIDPNDQSNSLLLVCNAMERVLNVRPSLCRKSRQLLLRGVPLRDASAGQKECLHILAVALFSKCSTLFFDEPGYTLHPTAQAFLLDELALICEKQMKNMVIITHSQHFLTNQTIQTCLVAAHGENGCFLRKMADLFEGKENDYWDKIVSPKLSRLFFGQKALLVEGESDLAVVSHVQRRIMGDGMVPGDIFDCQGFPEVGLEVACKLGIDVKVMLDIDKILENNMSGGSQTKNARGELKAISAKANKIKTFLKVAVEGTGRTWDSVEDELKRRVEDFGSFPRIFENANDDEKRSFRMHSQALREWIWEISGRRICVLGRDLEEEFIEHAENALCDAFNCPKPEEAQRGGGRSPLFRKLHGNRSSGWKSLSHNKLNAICDQLGLGANAEYKDESFPDGLYAIVLAHVGAKAAKVRKRQKEEDRRIHEQMLREEAERREEEERDAREKMEECEAKEREDNAKRRYRAEEKARDPDVGTGGLFLDYSEDDYE